MCNYSNTTIEHEGVNQILVRYSSKFGTISTTMIVVGIKPDVVLNFIEATYSGPEIIQGNTFSIDRVICKAHYSNGSVAIIKNFAINSNIVKFIGLNEYVVTYKENGITKTTTFGVTGLEKDSTTTNNYNPISLQNNYPEVTRLNNRYRGPAENYKSNSVNKMIVDNIQALYEIFTDIEQNFYKIVENTNGSYSIKTKTLNIIPYVKDVSSFWITNEKFKTGKYEKEVQNE